MNKKVSKCERCGLWSWQCRCPVKRKVGDTIEHKPGRKTDEEIKKANEGIVER